MTGMSTAWWARGTTAPALDILYFDAQTGLLAKSYTTMQSVLGGFPEETYYEDYRDASGLKVPFTMRVLSPPRETGRISGRRST